MRAMTSLGSSDPATSSAIWMSSPRSWFGSSANIPPERLPHVQSDGPAGIHDGRDHAGLAHGDVLVGAELAHGLARPAIERGVGIDQVAQFVTGDLQLDGEFENA